MLDAGAIPHAGFDEARKELGPFRQISREQAFQLAANGSRKVVTLVRDDDFEPGNKLHLVLFAGAHLVNAEAYYHAERPLAAGMVITGVEFDDDFTLAD